MAQLSSDQWLYLHQCLEAKWINGSTWGVRPPLGKQKLTNHQLGMSHVALGCQVWIYRDCNLGCTFSSRCHLCGALQESMIPNVSDIKCHTKYNLLQNTPPYQTVLGDFKNFSEKRGSIHKDPSIRLSAIARSAKAQRIFCPASGRSAGLVPNLRQLGKWQFPRAKLGCTVLLIHMVLIWNKNMGEITCKTCNVVMKAVGDNSVAPGFSFELISIWTSFKTQDESAEYAERPFTSWSFCKIGDWSQVASLKSSKAKAKPHNWLNLAQKLSICIHDDVLLAKLFDVLVKSRVLGQNCRNSTGETGM